MPKLSIVMPCYNHAEYVADAMRSVLEQTYTDFEFFAFDNGSTDNSWEVMQQFEDPRLHKIRLEENDLLEVKKQFIQKGTGKYCAIMYSDDYWKKEKLAKQMELIENNSEVRICFTWSDVVDENYQLISGNEKFFYESNRTQWEWMEYMVSFSNHLSCPSVVFERDLYIRYFGRLYPYRQLADYYCWLKILEETNIYMVEESLVLLRVHDSGENRNESFGNKENILRYKTELRHMIYKIIDEMKDDFFLRCFKRELVDKNTTSHIDVLCEKFFFFLRRAGRNVFEEDSVVQFYNQYFYFEENGVLFYMRLKEKYSFSRNDFFEYTGRANKGRGINIDTLSSRVARWELMENTDFSTLMYPEKIVIYGFGRIAKALYQRIKDYCKVEGFIDKNPKQSMYENIPIVTLDMAELNQDSLIVVMPSYDFEQISTAIMENSRFHDEKVTIIKFEDFMATGKRKDLNF